MTLPAGGAHDVSADPPAAARADGLTYSRRAAVAHLRSSDPVLGRVIDAVGPFAVRPDAALDPFAYLLRSIVYQQLNGAAAATIHGRVLALYGGTVPAPADLLGTDVGQLRAAGLSGNKAASVRSLAEHAVAGALPTAAQLKALDDVSIVRRLTAVRGVGPWTVHMLLLFQLGRPDVLPTGDFAVREGWRLMLGLDAQPKPAELRVATAPWRPYRSVASWYMWRVIDLARTGELPAVTDRV